MGTRHLIRGVRRIPVMKFLAAHALCACLLAFSGCTKKAAPAPNMAASMAAFRVPVIVAPATQQTIPVQVQVIGNVEAYSTVQVRSQVDGLIESVHFSQGQDVQKGQLLFSIDPSTYQAQLEQSQAALARDQAQLANARRQDERNSELFKAGIVSRDQYDTFRTNANVLEASVKADQAAIDRAKIDLGHCSIYSPVDGRTGSIQAYPGNIAKNDDTILVSINQIHPIYVTFAVPEQYLAEILRTRGSRSLPVFASVPASQHPPGEGTLSFIENSVDTNTGTIKMRATFANGDGRLWPGQFVNVTINLGEEPNATVVPTQAVQTGPTGKYIYVVKEDQSVELRPVQVGVNHDGSTVIDHGVAPGETVVTDGQLMLMPGAHVMIKKGL
jgi:membrane fusion protein, multidrug efflux system